MDSQRAHMDGAKGSCAQFIVWRLAAWIHTLLPKIHLCRDFEGC